MELTVRNFRSLPMKKETIIEVIDANDNKLAIGLCCEEDKFKNIDNRTVINIVCQSCNSITILIDIMENTHEKK